MNEGMEFNGIPVPKVHRPPSMIFRDEGNPAAGELSRPGIYRCVAYRRPQPGDCYYEPSEDLVLECQKEVWISDRVMRLGGPTMFPRVIVEAITPEPAE